MLSPAARRKDAIAAFEEAQVLAGAVAATRDWVNTPPGDLTPPAFADAVVEAAKPYARGKGKVTVTVLDEQKLAELGCGGILGVGGGSAAPPRLVELTYAPRGATPHLALVGKGITFDSGGLTIKPSASMTEMKSDMAGAAAVVQATFAIAQLGLPLKVSAFVPMAENMVAGASMRPGDVLTMYGGTTVEVLNTDAEGRLVLADALVRATERKPDVILDVATLTGHMVVALGDKVGGVMGDPDDRRPGARRVRRPPARRTGRCRSPRRWTTGSTAARSPTWPSTTGSAGAAGCSPRRSCASSPAASRGRTSTSPARRSTPAGPTVTSPRAAPASRVATLVEFARAMASRSRAA